MQIKRKNFFSPIFFVFLVLALLVAGCHSDEGRTEKTIPGKKEIEIFGTLDAVFPQWNNRYIPRANEWYNLFPAANPMSGDSLYIRSGDGESAVYPHSGQYSVLFSLASNTNIPKIIFYDPSGKYSSYFAALNLSAGETIYNISAYLNLCQIYDRVIPATGVITDYLYGDLYFLETMANKHVSVSFLDDVTFLPMQYRAANTNISLEAVYSMQVMFPGEKNSLSFSTKNNTSIATVQLRLHPKYQDGTYLNPKTNQKFQAGDTIGLWYYDESLGGMQETDAFPQDTNKQEAEVISLLDGLYLRFQITKAGWYICASVMERACVSLRLVDKQDEPIANLTVFAKGIPATHIHSAITDAEGRAKLFVKKALVQEKSQIFVLAGNFAFNLAEIFNPDYPDSQGCLDLGNFTLGNFSSIEGNVTQDGKAVSNCLIRTNANGYALTDENGYYKIDSQPCGNIAITLYNANREYQQSRNIETMEDQTHQVDFVLSQPAPLVKLSKPYINQKFLPGQPLELEAEISATRNAITSVKFYEEENLIGESANSPYTISWIPSNSGRYILYAVATDDQNLVGKSTSIPVLVNAPAQVAIASPANNTIFLKESQNVNIEIIAQASDTLRSIESITFFANDTQIAHKTSPPYSFTWTNVPVGSYKLAILAKDDLRDAVLSESVNIIVNGKPGIVFQSPINNQIFPTPANINISVNAQDQERSVASVMFYANDVLIANIPAPGPYSYVWNNAPVGQYTLQAVVKDNIGSESTASLSIQVLEDPMVVSSSGDFKSFGVPGGPFVPNSQTYTLSVLHRNISWQVNKNANWLTVVPASGTVIAGQPSQVVVMVNANANALPSNNYQDTLHFVNLTNAQGNTTREAVLTVNYNPSISISSPQEGNVFLTNSIVSIKSIVNDMDRKKRSIQRVEFYANDQKIGTISSAPYNYQWNASNAGQYALKAVVLDNLGGTATSNTVNITVSNAPSVVLQNPSAGSIFPAASNILLRALAQHSREKSISKVEFFRNNVLLGQGTSAGSDLYEYTWQNASAGTYTIKARATNNYGMTVDTSEISVEVNALPVVSIVSPSSNAIFLENSNITVQASATDTRGRSRNIQKVDFYANLIHLGTTTTGSNNIYSITWQNAPKGTYSLKAVATDDKNFASESSLVNITVNALPTISITSPSNGSIWATNRPISIVTNPVDTDRTRTIKSVKIYANNQEIASLTNSPYTYVWNPTVKNQYELKAVVTDNLDYTAVSNLVNIVVNDAPSVSITSPVNNSVFPSLSNISLRATATQSAKNPFSKRSITKVEFIINDSQYFTGVDQGSNVYEFTWTGVNKGNYTIKARATSDQNLVTESSTVTIEVDNPPSITILTPGQNSIFLENSDITIQANATDTRHKSITKVDFYANDILLGTTTSGTDNVYSFTWQKAPAGTYNIKAKVTDNYNFTNEDIKANIKLNKAPIITITSPANGAVFGSNSTVSIETQPSDTDRNKERTVSQVEIFANDEKIATLTTPPYQCQWNPPSEGRHDLKAAVTDNHGYTGNSNIVSIIVSDTPVVTILSPTNGSIFMAPANILLQCSAVDLRGKRSIDKVEFFANNALIGQASSVGNNIYEYAWQNIPYGNYTIKAKATDNNGLSTESSTIAIKVNIAPSISLDSPQDGAYFGINSIITLNATPVDNGRSVEKVEFFAGATKLATVITHPYRYDWQCSIEGLYALKATVTDDLGATADSNIVNITVNNLPGISIQNPLYGSILAAQQNIILRALAQDDTRSKRSITKVEFFVNDIFKGQATSVGNSLYEYTWQNVPEGSYILKAKATDNMNAVTESSAVPFQANNLPVISIISPANNAVLDVVNSIVIQAQASDPAGKSKARSIKQVDFYANNAYLGTTTTGTGDIYSYTWQNVSAGLYDLKAKATDNQDMFTESAIVKIKANLAPAIRIDYPVNNDIILETSQITIQVTASDPGRNITKVEFYSNGEKIGESTVSPYSFTWMNPDLGNHTLMARAWDDNDVSKDSTPVSIQIVPNYITITSSRNEVNYPVQIARPFIPGKIPNYPQAVIEGLPVVTQSDVKCRWADGSVKHAIISFILPSVRAKAPVKVSFQNQTIDPNTGFESKNNMLNNYNFDAVMHISNASNESASASARTMLINNHFTYWTKGTVCTTIILADHSQNRMYDMGFTDPQGNNYRSLRPIFHASFWPALKKVYVRFIGEIANTEALQGFWTSTGSIKPPGPYNLNLFLGDNYQLVYTKNSLSHYARTRWTKKFWLGGSVPILSIDHNLKYIVATKMLSNYDTSVQIPEDEIAAQYAEWTNASKDLFDAGNWQKYMPSTGGRGDIGPHPNWVVQWLYTGDKRMFEKACGNADLAAAWTSHLREGQLGRFFDTNNTVDAIGKVFSLNARVGAFLHQSHWNVPIKENPVANGDWFPDAAHCPDPYYALYLLTGEYWYLEQMYLWTGVQAGYSNPSHRGLDGKAGALEWLEIRGAAWAFRNRVRTAAIAPDSHPEKKYFEKLVEDVIAIWEGQRDITGTSYYNNANWLWGNSQMMKEANWGSYPIPTLHTWDLGNDGLVYGPDWNPSAKPLSATSPWMFNFLMYALGNAMELGYKTEALALWQGQYIVDAINTPPYYWFPVAYRIPTLNSGNNLYSTMAEVVNAYHPDTNFKLAFDNQILDANHGYPNIAMSASAAAKDANVPNSEQAWNWIKNNVIPDSNNASKRLPKWRILPRK